MITYSTKHGKTHNDKLTFELVSDLIDSHKDIYLASAYYDKIFFNKISESLKRSRSQNIKILVNGLAGRRLKSQIDELSDIEKSLSKYFAQVQIRVQFERGIFHTKAILFSSKNRSVALVGSANTTRAAYEDNEEILLKLETNVGQLIDYYERVWSRAEALEDLRKREISAKSLIQFFRTGILFFKSQTQLSKTVNPFQNLYNDNNAIRSKLSKMVPKIPFADRAKGIGPFNIERALDIDLGDEEDEERYKSTIRPYSVETCYGYWMPEYYYSEFTSKLKNASDSKRKIYEELRAELEKTGIKGIARKYNVYLNAVSKILKSVGLAEVDYEECLSENKITDFYNRTMRRLCDEDYVNRLASPFIDGVMPEIWDDPAATRDFKESFFTDLEQVANAPSKKVHRKVAKTIVKATTNRVTNPDAEIIEKSLEDLLRTRGWKDSNWK